MAVKGSQPQRPAQKPNRSVKGNAPTQEPTEEVKQGEGDSSNPQVKARRVREKIGQIKQEAAAEKPTTKTKNLDLLIDQLDKEIAISQNQNKDEELRLQAFDKAWLDSQKEERNLKKFVAIWIFALLGLEVVAGNTAFFFMLFTKLTIPVWVAETFFVGMYAQIIAIATIVVRSLFPQKSKPDTLKDMKKQHNEFSAN